VRVQRQVGRGSRRNRRGRTRALFPTLTITAFLLLSNTRMPVSAAESGASKRGSDHPAPQDPFATRQDAQSSQRPIEPPRLSHLQRRALDNCVLLAASDQEKCREAVLSIGR
jgi:hypothetical protein